MMCPLMAVVSTGRRNTLSHSFFWGLNPKVSRTLPAILKSPVSLPQSYTPSFPFKAESVASTG